MLCSIYLIKLSTQHCKVIYTQKSLILLNFCSAASFIAVADNQPLLEKPMPAPVSPHTSSCMQSNFPESSERHHRTILISAALALFKHVQRDINSLRRYLVSLLHLYKPKLFICPWGGVLHRTLGSVWVGKVTFRGEQFY